ncbi:TPA: hypothetical protein ACJ5DT_000051 [Legionella pneumophila]|uniref:hypothetical protein n=1 Tax=Legionella pneumophila TaxID=446 RepID=UPI000480A2A9|nr:hypothetical protein [Legionella pneumophila]APF02926.1 hypothetical protein BIZ52_05965 [Legionella pneumophila subsp. fraseri]APF05956.1 hypothetical protein BIZ51_06080 [Legionella pneumophila subsp. fraseri]AUB68415.1 hypothetical protein BJK09_06005 [Legionella pneumophila]AUB71388.1 hypothetical protein BJK08_06000 [Legionella pneumophila]KXB24132.1 hypothetical protein PtVF89_12385 [Legionella pneumophila]
MNKVAERAGNQMTCGIANPNESDFKRQLIHDNALANNSYKEEGFDLDKEKQSCKEAMTELNTSNGLQSMLAAQMLSVHKLQQKSMCYAQNIKDYRLEKYYVNAGIKLANCFVQQANLLAKLQGLGSQKITVERVEVHQGGQAIVGNIQGGMGNKE